MVSKRSDGFAARESGAASFDWVILLVGVFGLGLAVFSVFTAEIEDRAPDPQPPIVASTSQQPDVPLLYPYFDLTWRSDQAAYFAQLEEEDLLWNYAAQYAVAMGEVNTRIGADYLAVIEEEMIQRGLSLPAGNETAADIRARIIAELALP